VSSFATYEGARWTPFSFCQFPSLTGSHSKIRIEYDPKGGAAIAPRADSAFEIENHRLHAFIRAAAH